VIALLAAVLALVLVALVVGGVIAVRRVQGALAQTRQHVTWTARALAAQLVHEREEHRGHLDAAAAVAVAQLTAQLVHEREEHRRHVNAAVLLIVAKVRPVRPVPSVEVRPAPPLPPRSEEATPPAGSRAPWGAA